MDEFFIEPEDLSKRLAVPAAPVLHPSVGIATTIEGLRLQIVRAFR